MKKTIALLFILTLTLTGCSAAHSEPSKSSTDTSVNSANDSTGISNQTTGRAITDGVYATYDYSKYENISAPKIYNADYQKIEEEIFFDMFSGEPTYLEEIKQYSTENESGWYRIPTDKVRYYTMFYSTSDGSNCTVACSKIYSDFSTTLELDFMTREEMQTDFTNFINNIFQTGVNITAYAIKKEGNSNDWKAPEEFYYIKAQQTVDGVPIFNGVVGGPHKGGYTYGPTIEAVYTEKGMECITVMIPYKILSEAPTSEKFITLSDAENIIKNMYENLLTYNEVTFTNAELVYVPVYSSGNLLLTPAWEFSDDFGPFYRIDAYTGEEIR